ncbi:MAG: hypothetical protein NG737_05080 [Omnitrophica bacterium]|nr:hypothetical protein [Candidatus Omnitrophota bacterium]
MNIFIRRKKGACSLVLLIGFSLLGGWSSYGYNRSSSVQPNGHKDYTMPGPYKVLTLEYPDLIDSSRYGRRVPILVLYPESEGKFPLVIFSHGAAGHWYSHYEHAVHMASHGYIVMCPVHVYSDNKRVKLSMKRSRKLFKFRKFMEGGRKVMKDPRAVLGRPKDISFVIDQAERWHSKRFHPLEGRIKLDRIAVGGHSFGAYTTYAVVGARPILDHLNPPLTSRRGLGPDLSDPRVTVGIAMSPQGPDSNFFGSDSFKTIQRPLLCFSGSKDKMQSADGSTLSPLNRLKSFKLMPKGEKYYLWLKNAGHMGFSGTGGKAYEAPARERRDVMRITKAMMLVFCDLKLKGLTEAGPFLSQEYAVSLIGKRVPRIIWYQK